MSVTHERRSVIRAPLRRRLVSLAVSLAALILALVTGGRQARADVDAELRPATFALIVGSNRSVDADVAPLRYADDDAARYLDMFRLMGARTYLLTRLDDNTRRLHPQAAGEALEPRGAVLASTVAQIAADITRARERHLKTALYVVYAGHGGVDDQGEGYIALEDTRIRASDLASMIARLPAEQVHVIVDACASYFLAYSRGPGGQRRPVRGFQDAPQLAADPRVGLLLSTSSARESHEWDEYQAGVFSHEVRSGLYGAADADGDGRVTYREIAAFVVRANAAIPNERFRPDVHAKAPSGSETLMDLRQALGRHLDISGAHAAHYWIEDGQGVRLLDLHNGAGGTVHLVRPGPTGRVFLRRQEDGVEFLVPPWPDAIALDDLAPAPAAVATRGAEHEAFRQLFALPFDASTVAAYVPAAADESAPPSSVASADVATSGSRAPWRTITGWSAIGVGAAAVVSGVALSVAATSASHGASPTLSQTASVHLNNRISTENTAAVVADVGGGVAILAGVLALAWPAARNLRVDATTTGGALGYRGSF